MRHGADVAPVENKARPLKAHGHLLNKVRGGPFNELKHSWLGLGSQLEAPLESLPDSGKPTSPSPFSLPTRVEG